MSRSSPATLQREQIEQWLEGARDPLGHPGWHPTNGDIKALCELALSALSETGRIADLERELGLERESHETTKRMLADRDDALSARSATRCTACGAKVGEPCRGNCERAMPSSIGDTTASSTMYVNGHFDIREALDKPTRKADLDLARYILKNLCGWNCRDVVSDEERDTEYLADMISAARYGHATQSATGDTTHPLCQSCSVSNNPRNGRCWSCGEKLPSHLNGRSI
jgi:hypothetical protein